ncbi:MAG: hypothetical protein LCH73_02930 [Proteobacteria bacterium]|nr:hypothetical protein [Pseudomonadota bacterium]
MPISVKNSLILVKTEATPGVDSGPTPAANAVGMQVDDFSSQIEQRSATNETVGTGFGSQDMIPYARRGKVAFKVPLAGSGGLTPPSWNVLLGMCAVSETAGVSPTRLEYMPASTNLKTTSLWAYVNGELGKFAYAVGNGKMLWEAGKVPTLGVEGTGLVTSVTDVATPAATLTSWKRPLAFGPATCAGVNLGGTYAAGAITGGTFYSLKSLELDMGNDIVDLELAGPESIGVYDWAPKLTLTADIAPAALTALYAAMHAGTLTSVGMQHGNVAGSKLLFHAGQCAITGIEDVREGKLFLTKLSLACQPSSAGNDAWRLVHL